MLSQLLTRFMVLPHSSASVEIIFSLVSHDKTKTNSLKQRRLRKSSWQKKHCQEASKTAVDQWTSKPEP